MLKQLFIAAALLFCGDCKAEGKKVIECKITLDADEFINQNKQIYIKASIVPEIINKTHTDCELVKSFDAWNIIDFKVFIYVECDWCHGLYLVDHGCTNPKCPSKNL